MITEKNIFEQGMLIHLKIGSYDGRKKLDQDQLKELPPEIVRGVHDLFDKEFKDILQEVWKHDGETRDYVKRKSVPFPIDGVYFIDSKKIEAVIEYLDNRKKVRLEIIDKAVQDYEAAIERFAFKYPDFYERAKRKYLTKGQFMARFHMRYQFIKIQAPSQDDKFISPEMYKLEMAKFKDTINEMKKEVLGTIYEVLLETTERLKKQCTEGKPNQRTFNSLNEFLTQIDDVYSEFVDRQDMKKVIKKIKASVLGVQADSLRDSEELKKKFGEEIGKIAREIKAMPDVPMKRALDF